MKNEETYVDYKRLKRKMDFKKNIIYMNQDAVIALSKEERAANGIMPIINRDVINKVAEWILDFTNDDISKAAKILGIKENRLIEIMKEKKQQN